MKTKLFLVAVILFACNHVYAQFQQSIGDLNQQYGKSVQTLSGNTGYVVAGYTNPGLLGLNDANIVITDSNGVQQWTHVYGGAKNDYFNSVRDVVSTSTNPLAYVAAGHSNSFSALSDFDMFLVGTDASGTPLFSKTFGGSKTDKAYCLQKIVDPNQKPGLVMVGETSSFPSLFAGINVYVVRTDMAGNLQDAVVIGTPFNEAGHWIEQTKDRGYIIAGYTTARCSSDTIANKNIYVIKLDAFLNVTWNRIFAGPKSREDVAFCVRENPIDNSFIITGHTKSYTYGGESFLLNLSAAGALNWFRVYGGARFESGENVIITRGAGGVPQYLVSGYSNSFSSTTTNYDAMLFKTNLAGTVVVWTRTYAGTNHEYSYEVDEHMQSGSSLPGYVQIGRTPSFGAGGLDHLLIETDNNGVSGSICEKKPIQKIRKYTPCFNSNAQHVHVNLEKTVQSQYKKLNFTLSKCSVPSRTASLLSSEEEESSSLKVMPVPAHATIDVSFKEDCNGGILNVMNSQGQIVKTATLDTENISLEISDLSEGLYFIQVIKKDGSMDASRFIKK